MPTPVEDIGKEPPPLPGPVADIFAGGEPIKEENQGNIEDFYEGRSLPQSDTRPPDTPPTAESGMDGQSPAQAEAAAKTGQSPKSAEEGRQEDSQPKAESEQPAAQADAEKTADSGEQVPDKPAAEDDAGMVDSKPVPSFRLAQEAARRRAAEARTAELEKNLAQLQQQQQPPQNQPPQPVPPQPAPEPDPVPEPKQLELDFGDDPKQMFDKVLDGDLDKATELLSNMLKKTAEQTQQSMPQQQQQQMPTSQEQVQQLVQQQIAQQRAREDELAVVRQLEEAVPQFNPASDKFDKDLVDETLALQAAYMQKHYTPAEAMDRAAEAVLRLNDIQRTAAQAEAAAKVGLSGQQVEKKVAAANAQPPSMPKGSGESVLELDVLNMTEEEFNALPESTIARLRGDFG